MMRRWDQRGAVQMQCMGDIIEVELLQERDGSRTGVQSLTLGRGHEEAALPIKEAAPRQQLGEATGSQAMNERPSQQQPMNTMNTRPSEASTVPAGIGPIKPLRLSQQSWVSNIDMLKTDSCALMLEGIDDLYDRGAKLGSGSFGTVYKIKSKKTGKYFALKTVEVKDEWKEASEAEIFVSCQLDHPYIVMLHGFVKEEKKYHLVLDLCTGGDLWELLRETVKMYRSCLPGYMSGLQSDQMARYAWQMLSGLTFLHHHGFVHRDIKPENYLLVTTDETSPVKLTDFGLTAVIPRGGTLKDMVGTVHYVAPEMFRGGYNQLVDVWSLGVTCFHLLTNQLPYEGVKSDDYVANLKANTRKDCEVHWEGHWSKMRALVDSLMVHDPSKRPSAKHVLTTNMWLKAYGEPAGGCCAVS